MTGGFWGSAASISVGGRHIANGLTGRVRDEELDEAKILEYVDRTSVDRELFRTALA